MKTSELIRILKQHGCYLVRHGSSHDIWSSPKTNKNILVGRHLGQEMNNGTFRRILKEAGIKI